MKLMLMRKEQQFYRIDNTNRDSRRINHSHIVPDIIDTKTKMRHTGGLQLKPC